MQIGTDPDSQIQIQEFFMQTLDSHRIPTVRYGSPPLDPVGLQTIYMCERYLNLRHLVDPKYRNPEFSWIMVFSRGSGSQNTTIFYDSPEHIRTGWSCQFRTAHAFGTFARMPWMPVGQ
jgi:hypothetical protein